MSSDSVTLAKAPRWRFCLVLGIGTALLWLSMAFNAWTILNPSLFYHFQRDNEGMVIGRLLRSEQQHPFSDGMQLGTFLPPDFPARNDFLWQHKLYQPDNNMPALDSLTWRPYSSHPGGQGLVASLLASLLPGDMPTRFRTLQVLSSLLAALTMIGLCWWSARVICPAAGVVVFVCLFISYFPLQFGGRIYWQLWSFYLPAGVVWLGIRKGWGSRRLIGWTAAAIFGKILFSGFEYITCALLMPYIPIVYEGLLAEKDKRCNQMCRQAGWISGSILIGLTAGLCLLFVQLLINEGSLGAAFSELSHKLSKRTIGEPGFGETATYWHTLSLYLNAVLVDLNPVRYVPGQWFREWVLTIRGWECLAFGLLVSVWLWIRRSDRLALTLLVSLWLSLSVSFSWIIIFKAHSATHDHMNPIVWYMPYILILCWCCGLIIQQVIMYARARTA